MNSNSITHHSIPNLTLSNGVAIPCFGLGTYQLDKPNINHIIKNAVASGYRHIDTASAYHNETEIGQALKEIYSPSHTDSNPPQIKREDLFIVSKVWNDQQGYDTTIKSYRDSLTRLQLNDLDLFLIHWPLRPFEKTLATWRALEELYLDGKVKAIGVCNFKEHHLDQLLANCQIPPMINQVELHPQFPQVKLRNYCHEHKIIVSAWAPLVRGKIFDHPVLIDLSNRYKKTVAQIILRWHLQQNIVVIPKTSNISRLKENSDVFNFSLNQSDLTAMEALEGDRVWFDPDTINF